MWLRTEDRGMVRWLTIDRPERKNAIPGDGWDTLRIAIDEAEQSTARILVVTGAGGNFCSGADLSPDQRDTDFGVTANRDRMIRVGAAALALHRLGKPSIAAVDGVAAGAGMNLALGCDLVVATTRARFFEIFVRRGLVPDFGGSWLLPRIVGLQRAKELALTGRAVEADEALEMGLVLEVVEPDSLLGRVEELAAALLGGAPVAQMLAKRALNRAFELSFEQGLAEEGQSQAICFTTDDAREGVAAFVAKRPPDFRGR
ncbi:MAG: enoyl-CoA hydratase/isomerase family protein [Actinomycetota bacterium]